jgi:hypothetical protein
MEKKELKKEALISLWNKECKGAKNKEAFITAGTDTNPYYILSVDDGIMLNISATPTTKGGNDYDYKIGVVFGEFVEYANFEMDKSEFDSLADLFMVSYNEKLNDEINKIVEDKEKQFFDLISSVEV